MKSVGITAEYNPFHNGHKYNIEQAKSVTGSDCAVVIMSGDFMERGIPAMTDKFTRARCALMGGADLVIELPTVYATASAELFALGSIGIMNGLGGIDNVAFGCEASGGDFHRLSEIAEILSDEPDEYRTLLSGFLSEGLTMPAAREKAVTSYTGDDTLGSLLSKPNNILAIEYMKALRYHNSPIIPTGIERKGAGYNDDSLSSEFASASGIRKAVNSGISDHVRKFMPEGVFDILQSRGAFKRPVTADDMSSLLYYALSVNRDSLEKYSDAGTSLANRLRLIMNNASFHSSSFTDIAMSLKSADITYTRVCRALCHIILGITADDITGVKASGCCSYARILGFNDTGRAFLSSVKKTSQIPIISNCKDDSSALNGISSRVFQIDKTSADIYNRIVYDISGRKIKDDFRSTVITG
ncbi:MAG: nucleotidyltransferase family protein [Butyrivibrio sp.]